MLSEKEVLHYLERFQKAYLEERNMERTVELLADNIYWIDKKNQMLCEGKENLKKEFKRLKIKQPSSILPDRTDLHAFMFSEGKYMIEGKWILEENSTLLLEAVLQEENGKGKFSYIHLDEKAFEESERLLKISRELENKEEYLETIIKNVPGGIFNCNYDDPLSIIYMSDGFLSMFGYTKEEVKSELNNSFRRMIHPQDREPAEVEVKRQLAKGNSKELEYRLRCKDGSYIWVLDKGQLMKKKSGEEYFCCIVVDITNAHRAQEELWLSLQRHRIIMKQTNDVIFEWDMVKDRLSYSSNWKNKFGCQPLTENFSNHMESLFQVYKYDVDKFKNIFQQVKNGIPYLETEVRFNKTGGYFWCKVRISCQYDKDGNPVKAVGIIIDIDNEKKISQELKEKAEQDTLTMLFNKGTVQAKIKEYLNNCSEDENSALIMIDVDDFKLINDTLGHLFGDAFLMEVANEMKKIFRQSDILGRIGGDEFIVYIKNISDVDVARKKAEEIINAFQCLKIMEKKEMRVSCSIGISICPVHGNDFKTLYKKADYALYRAKKKGKNGYVIYSGELASEDEDLKLPKNMHTVISEIIDSEQEDEKSLNSTLIEYVFRILYKSMDIEIAAEAIIEIVGRQFDVSRVYIFENTEDDAHCCNTFEWCNEGIKPEKENLQCVSYKEDLGGNYLDNFDNEGIFYCRDITKLPDKQRQLFGKQGIKSLLQCAVRDNGICKGFVGFDECRVNRFWTKEQISALTFISEILSTFLLKKRLSDRLTETAAAMRTVLDNQNSLIYVIDPDTYVMYYINKSTKNMAPSVKEGMTCYKAFFNSDEPCSHCPVKGLSEEKKNQTMEIYNPAFDIWTSADGAVISWKGKKAYMLTCRDITKFMKDTRPPEN